MNGSITSGRVGLPCLLWSLMVALLMGGGVARAEPRTLYKPEDINNARRNLKRFEWAERIVDGWKRSVEFAMRQDRRFFEELIPELTPGSPYTNGYPACVDPDLLACGPVPMSEEAPRPRTGFEIESFTADSITVRDYPVVECDEVEVLHSSWQCPKH